MSAILGLVGSESFAAQRFTNIRQQVFYKYPNGAFPIAGLLSVAKEKETNDPKFSHYEKRMQHQWTTTLSQGSSKGPFMTSVGADAGATVAWTADTEYQIKVASTDMLRGGHIIQIKSDTTSDSTVASWLTAVVTDIVSSTVVKVRANATVANVKNSTTNQNVGKQLLVIGSGFREGDNTDSTRELYNLPVEIYNYTQIFRNHFSFTGTSLATSLKYDETGPYKDKAKETSLQHMKELEMAILFGERKQWIDTNTGLPMRLTGGILWYMRQWELDTFGTGVVATADSDDDKRIIANSAGTIDDITYHAYLERLFRVTNNAANEKLCVCGSGFLLALQNLYRGQTVLQAQMGKETTFGLNVLSHTTVFGTVHYKTHPLFNENPDLRYNALFLDANNMNLRPMLGRNTRLLKNLQPNNADFRMDEWRGELGFEMDLPESCMYLQNVRTAVV